jgi:hypothetical protein
MHRSGTLPLTGPSDVPAHLLRVSSVAFPFDPAIHLGLPLAYTNHVMNTTERCLIDHHELNGGIFCA